MKKKIDEEQKEWCLFWLDGKGQTEVYFEKFKFFMEKGLKDRMEKSEHQTHFVAYTIDKFYERGTRCLSHIQLFSLKQIIE